MCGIAYLTAADQQECFDAGNDEGRGTNGTIIAETQIKERVAKWHASGEIKLQCSMYLCVHV